VVRNMTSDALLSIENSSLGEEAQFQIDHKQ
jgi:hypothetical protein